MDNSTSTDLTMIDADDQAAEQDQQIEVIPRFQEPFYDPATNPNLKYLWSFYVQSTSRFCAIHDYETPFLSSVVPMAAYNPALQTSLMFLSSIYRNKILGLQDPNHETVAAELSVATMRNLRGHLSLNLTPPEALVGITACLGLCTSYIGENNRDNYNMHLYGALMIATQVIVPNKTFLQTQESWFVFKWLTYCQILVNVNLLAFPERLVVAKAQNLNAMKKLYVWWQIHAHEDPEYNLPVDSFYGFGTRLAPMLLQLNILVTRNALFKLGHEAEPVSDEEISELETSLWCLHESSVLAQYSVVMGKNLNIDLLHCDTSFHGAALLYIYTYLKPSEHSRIPHLVTSIINDVQAISPVCRTAGALLFVMYITGSYAYGEQRRFIQAHLSKMKQTCLSSVESLLQALDLIWKLRDEQNMDMIECHKRVIEAGINVCVY